jgi:hypothetical protein
MAAHSVFYFTYRSIVDWTAFERARRVTGGVGR